MTGKAVKGRSLLRRAKRTPLTAKGAALFLARGIVTAGRDERLGRRKTLEPGRRAAAARAKNGTPPICILLGIGTNLWVELEHSPLKMKHILRERGSLRIR
jgi:hypothetical protein